MRTADTHTTDANYFGPDSSTYRAKDSSNATSTTAVTVSLTVTPVNDAPSFTKGPDKSISESAGPQSFANWAPASVSGPLESQTLNFVIDSASPDLFDVGPAVSPTGTLTFTPTPGASGVSTVTLHLHDNGGTANPGDDDTSGTQQFHITIDSINHAPSFTKGADQVDPEDAGPQSGSWASAISQGAGDSGQTLTFVIDSNSNVGLFSSPPTVSPTGTLAYTAKANTSGTATIALHLEDDGGTANGGDDTSVPASFTITVTPVNDAPSFTKGSNQTAFEDTGAQSVPGWVTVMSKGPADEAAQTLDFVIDSVVPPTLFSVAPAVTPTGTLTYTPAPNANGVATIGLHIHDSGGGTPPNVDFSPTVTFKITITGVNDLPTCSNDSSATFVDAALVNAPLTSCVDLDADTLTYSLVTPSTHGTTVVHTNGTYTYTPNTAYQGTDTFTFKTNDGTGDSNTATISILVSPDPIARNDVAPTDFPAIIQGSGPTAIPVLANDLDKQGGPLTIESVTQGAKGSVAITGGGTGLTYDPTGLNTGTDSFRYTIIDNQSRRNSAIVVVSIVKDTVRPVATVPWVQVIGPSTLGTTTVKVRINWSGSDVGTGVKSYSLQESVSGGSFKNVTLASPLSRSAVRNVTINKGYRYRVRANDAVGNFSVLAYSLVTTAVRVQETSTPIAYGGHWGVTSSTTYSGGAERWTTVTGASATYTFSGLGIAWIAAKGSSHGGAQVFIDGLLVGSVNQYASQTAARQVLFATRFATAGVHTIKIVASGTAGHPRIDLDTFILLR